MMNKNMLLVMECFLTSLAIAAPSEAYKCYKPDNGKDVYPWSADSWWFPSTGTSTACGVPTEVDHVFLYSSKNNVAGTGIPMTVADAVIAKTGILEIGDANQGQNYVIGIDVATGGKMVNSGNVLVGNSGSRYTGGGLLQVMDGGEWDAKADFILGLSAGVSWLNVRQGGVFGCAGEFIAGNRSGGSGVVTNEGVVVANDLFVGGEGVGVFENRGTLEVTRKFVLGRKAASSGTFHLSAGGVLRKSRTGSYQVAIANGADSHASMVLDADVTLAEGDTIDLAIGDRSSARLVVNEGVKVSGITALNMGLGVDSVASVELDGGTLGVLGSEEAQARPFNLGKSGTCTSGRIIGWGTVCNDSDRAIRANIYGQLIADGQGESRDLNLAAIRTLGRNASDAVNTCGTNGWYAVNKGRMIYPRSWSCTANQVSHPTMGDYPTRQTPTMINSFTYSLTQSPAITYYNFAELYAADREDVPAGLPKDQTNSIVGIWRIGLSSMASESGNPTPVSFGGMTIAFRYDHVNVPTTRRVSVYHHDGSEKGAWRKISDSKDVSATDNLITTKVAVDASSEVWNAGWFAIVAQDPQGLLVVFR